MVIIGVTMNRIDNGWLVQVAYNDQEPANAYFPNDKEALSAIGLQFQHEPEKPSRKKDKNVEVV